MLEMCLWVLIESGQGIQVTIYEAVNDNKTVRGIGRQD